MNEPVVIIGAGGHARGIAEILNAQFDVAGWIDNTRYGETIDGISVIGSDDDLPELLTKGISNAIIGVGSVGDSTVRQKLAARVECIGFAFVTAIHASAVVSTMAEIGAGSCVCAGAVVQRGTTIGEHCIINTSSVVDHDCSIGDYSHVAPGAVVAGGVTIGRGVHVGANAVVKEGVSIVSGVVIGAGAVVTKDVTECMVLVGNPAKAIR